LDENEELNALTLTTLLNSGVEEALSNLSPAQLIQLEKNVQKLKRQKSTTGTPIRTPKSSSGSASRKRRMSDSDAVDGDDRPRPSGGQYMNLPASTPQVEWRDGIEWLNFTYSTKGHIQEYCIRVDVDELSLDEIPEDFKNDNCVYPRALVPRDAYIGNRWEYETSVNEIAWKLVWRNAGVLSGKRGLIQRAVDSYRNRTPENRSRRVMRQEKLVTTSGGSSARKRSAMEADEDLAARVPGPKTLTLQYTTKDGEQSKVKIRVDIDAVDLSQMDEDFRCNNCIYPQALTDRESYTEGRWEYENACNELAWKLSWLNSQKLAGKRNLLQKAVDAYQSRAEAAERVRRNAARHGMSSMDHGVIGGGHGHDLDDVLLDKNEEFSQMVANTLQQALSQHVEDLLIPSDMHHHQDDDDDDDERRPKIVSTAELMHHSML